MTNLGPTLPTGTVTFLRTDVEGSMRLARALGRSWDDLNALQLGLIRRIVDEHGGVCVRTEGDAYFGVFGEAGAAVSAAIECQRTLSRHDWPAGHSVRVRIGLHSGEAHLAGDDFGGFDVNRAARIAAVGHGGQIVLSDPTRALVETDLPEGVTIRDLGRHVLRDVPDPERLHQLDVPGLGSDFPPLRTGAPTGGNLPPRLTSFVGREVELRDLTALLGQGRLVTLTGPGGIGKTSLAVELARSRLDDHPDGAWFVALDGVSAPEHVATAIARSLGLYDGPGRPVAEGLARHLSERAALLVLDNFEHVLPAAGTIVQLLGAAPWLRIVVTSRAPLRVGPEQEFPVGPLGSREAAGDPVSDRSAPVRLFEDRARGVRPDWRAGDDPAIVREICRRLDDLPLGIELAAARVAVLPVGAIRDRLAARLPLPGAGRRDVPDRQRTLESAIAWSHDLLELELRPLLARLSVFEGSFDIAQAEVVAGPASGPVAGYDGDVLEGLVALADQSLLVARPPSSATDGSVRFSILETIRAFAGRRLAESGAEEDARRLHAEAFLALAEQAAPHLPGRGQAPRLDRLALDHDNLRAAIRWSTETGRVELAQRLAAALWRYWQIMGHLREGRSLVDAVIAMPGGAEPTVARAWALGAAGGLAYWQADTARAHQLYMEQRDVTEQVGDPAAEADANVNLCATGFITGDAEFSTAALERAAAIFRELGDEIGLGRLEWPRANLLIVAGRVDEAVAILDAAWRRYEQVDDAVHLALTAGAYSWLAMMAGDLASAARWGSDGLLRFHAMRDITSATITIEAIAVVAIDAGRPMDAATMLGAWDALCEVHGVQSPFGLRRMIMLRQPNERTRAALTPDQFDEAFAAGGRMTLDEAVAFAASLCAEVAEAAQVAGAAGTGDAPPFEPQ